MALDDTPWLRSYDVWSQLAVECCEAGALAFHGDGRDAKSAKLATKYEAIHAARHLDAWSDASLPAPAF